MKTTKRITETQLRNIIHNVIMEEVQNQMQMNNLTEEDLDEGLWDTMKNVGRSLKGTFGGDANRVQNAGNNAMQTMRRGAQSVGRSVADAGRRVGKAAQQAGQNVRQYGQDRVNAFKGQYQANKNIGKIQDLLSTIDELQQDGTLSGPQMTKAIEIIKTQLNGAISRNKGTVTGWQNSVK